MLDNIIEINVNAISELLIAIMLMRFLTQYNRQITKMESESLFAEIQRFKQWRLWFILFGIKGLTLYGVFKQILVGRYLVINRPSGRSL